MLKNVTSGVLAATLAILGMGLCDSGEAAEKTIRINYGHRASMASEIHTAAWILKNYVNENSDTLEVVLYPNSGLGQVVEVYEAMRLGSGASCQISGTAELNGFYKRIGVFDLPFLYANYDQVHRIFDGEAGQTIANELADAIGIKIVAFMDSWGYRNVVTRDKPVNTAADLKGLKIRTLQSPVYVAALEVLGANATPMAYGEVYTAVQTGVLDGYEVTASMIETQKFYEVSKHIALTQHLFTPLVLACSVAEWNKLTPEEQTVFEDGAKLARDIQRGLAPLREAESFAFLKDNGMDVTEIDMSALLAAAPKMQEEFAEKLGATDLLELVRSAGTEN